MKGQWTPGNGEKELGRLQRSEDTGLRSMRSQQELHWISKEHSFTGGGGGNTFSDLCKCMCAEPQQGNRPCSLQFSISQVRNQPQRTELSPKIHVHTFVLCAPSLCLCLALSETQNKAFLSWAVLGIGTGRVGQEKTLNKANK